MIAVATCADLSEREVDDRPLLAAFRELGVEVRLVVWDDSCIDWSRFDACLIRTTWDYAERLDEYVAWADRVTAATRLFNSAQIVRWNTRKDYLAELEARGAPLAPTVWLERGSSVELVAVLRERGWRRGFLKPVVGATARETLRFSTRPAEGESGLSEAQAHVDRLLPREDLMLQPYYSSVETEGEFSAIFIDGECTHAVRKLPVPGDYRVQDDFGASDEAYRLEPDELELARTIVEMVETDLLYARVDFLLDEQGRMRLNELELVEPALFFRHGPHAAERLARALMRAI